MKHFFLFNRFKSVKQKIGLFTSYDKENICNGVRRTNNTNYK